MNFECAINSDLWKRLDALVSSRLYGELTESQVAELERLLGESDEATELYVELIEMSVFLPRALAREEAAEDGDIQRSLHPATPVSVQFPSLSPLPTLSTARHTPPTSFIDGPVFSYLVATVVLCVMLLGFWTYKITRVAEVAEGKGKPSINSPADPRFEFVGHVTGMKDCVWNEGSAGTMVGALVPLGREYALSSGLIELTYVSGAKVILEGPCRYKVDSRAGGFLERGKLTARVDNAKPQAASSESPAPSPQAPVPLFTVTTPTAVVTDLGTEFGVEVDENGDTASYVFRGSIKVRAAEGLAASADSGTALAETVLHENESIRVSRVHETHQNTTTTELVRFTYPARMPEFVRKMHEQPKLHEYAKAVLADGPLFYWTFDEPYGPAEEQVRHLPHQALKPLHGAGRCDHSGIGSGLALGRAADFSKYANVFSADMSHKVEFMPGPWAIEFWAQATGSPGDSDMQYILSAGIGGHPPYYRDKPAVIFNSPYDAEKYEVQLLYPRLGQTRGGPKLSDNRWRHLLLVYYGNGSRLGIARRFDVVVDGQRKTIDLGGFTTGISLKGKLCVGAASLNGISAFHGRIDELALYDFDKTTITVQQLETRIADMGKRHFAAARLRQEDDPSSNEPGGHTKNILPENATEK